MNENMRWFWTHRGRSMIHNVASTMMIGTTTTISSRMMMMMMIRVCRHHSDIVDFDEIVLTQCQSG